MKALRTSHACACIQRFLQHRAAISPHEIRIWRRSTSFPTKRPRSEVSWTLFSYARDFHSRRTFCDQKGNSSRFLWSNELSAKYAEDEQKWKREAHANPLFRTLISLINDEKYEQAKEVVLDLKASSKLSTAAYNLAMKCFFNEPQEVLTLFREMELDRVKPNITTFNSIIASFGKKGDLDQMIHWFEEMKQRGITPDWYSYTPIIDAFGKKGDIKQMNAWFKKMVDSGFQPTLTTFSTLCNALAKKGETTDLVELVKGMKRLGIDMDTVLYTNLIDAFGRKGDIKQMMAWYAEMREAGKVPDEKTFTHLIGVLAKSGLVERMFECFEEMVASGLRPNAHTIAAMITSLIQHRDIKSVEKCVELMERHKVKLDTFIYTTLIVFYCRDKRNVDKGVQLFNQMKSNGCKPNSKTFAFLITGCGWSRRPELISSLVREAIQLQIPLCSAFYSAVVDAYSRNGRFAEAAETLVAMQRAGLAWTFGSCHVFLRMMELNGKLPQDPIFSPAQFEVNGDARQNLPPRQQELFKLILNKITADSTVKYHSQL